MRIIALRQSVFRRGAPIVSKAMRPISVLVVGDSWSSDDGNPAPGGYFWWGEMAPEGVSFVMRGTPGKCLVDTTSPLGEETMFRDRDADIAAAPDADIVVVATAGVNDFVRLARDDNYLTLPVFQAAATTMINTYIAAKKGVVMVGVPLVKGILIGDNIEAQVIARQYNAWLADFCVSKNIACVDPGFLCNAEGLKPEYDIGDTTHLNANGTNALKDAIMGCVKAFSGRKAAA